MKILLLFPMADGQTGPAIKYAFEQLGHKVQAVDAKLQPHDSYKVAYEFEPDLIFCSRTQALAWKVTEIKAKFKNAVACMWNVDTRTNISHWKHLFPLIQTCDYYFVVASRLIPEWKKINPNTFWLPQGLQNEIYHKPKEITGNDKNKYSCDVSFAGRERGIRREMLNTVEQMDVNLKKWGCGGIPKVYNEKHNKMVSQSKINLCCSGWPENGAVTSVRDYKIMGAGGFVLELYRKGLDDIFAPEIMDIYLTSIDLVSRIRYWLNHEDERKAMAERSYEWVHANATYTHRIKKALEIMGL